MLQDFKPGQIDPYHVVVVSRTLFPLLLDQPHDSNFGLRVIGVAATEGNVLSPAYFAVMDALVQDLLTVSHSCLILL